MISLKLQAMTSDAKINEIKKKFLVYNAKLIELQVWQKWVTTGAEHTLAIMRANSKKKRKITSDWQPLLLYYLQLLWNERWENILLDLL